MRGKILRKVAAKCIAGVLVVAAATAVAPTQPASAHEAGDFSCSSGALCLWIDAHYLGGRYSFFGTNSSIHAWDIADEDSASRNNGTSGLRARVWQHTNYGGNNTVCLAMGARLAHHFENGDQASSNDWSSSCG